MARPLIIPSLADLSQDIAGSIPVDLVTSWMASGRDNAAHATILEPYRRHGTVVCSDSAGLSKLSAARPLVEVMKLVSEPKEAIYAHGVAIGGRAVGVWAADNTQMFYHDTIDAGAIVRQMIAAQRAIATKTVQVGIGIDIGTVYEIGGGLYGSEADAIEGFTEEETRAGEVVVSEDMLALLREPRVKEQRGSMYVLEHETHNHAAAIAEDYRYPAPFDRAFHDAIRALDPSDSAALDAINARYAKEKTIVLLRTFLPHGARLLDECVTRVAANEVVHRVLADDRHRCLVKSNGALAIIATDDALHGADLGKRLLKEAREKGFDANVGVARGDVLMFDLEDGTRDIAGAPVNVASKIAEDTDERGRAFFEASVAEAAARLGPCEAFKIGKSGLEIHGVKC